MGEAAETVPVPFHGEPFEIGLDPEFLRDGLESVESDELVLKLISPLRPGLIESPGSGDFVYLIMPIRLNVERRPDTPALRESQAARCERGAARLSHLPARRRASRRGRDRRPRAQRGREVHLLEALYFGCTARSPRTRNERELVRFGAAATRVVVRLSRGSERHELSVGYEAAAGGERAAKRMSCDGAAVQRLADVDARPLMSVFDPDRLELVKGSPGARRAHLDQVVAAIWPARAGDRREHARVLSQRNALLARIRSGGASRATLSTWDRELAARALVLRDHRRAAAELLSEPFAQRAAASWAAAGARRWTTVPGPGPATRTSSSPSCRRAWSSTWRAASPLTDRTVMSWRSCATGASCACTAHRASSGWPCSPCSWPSAR